MGNKNKVFISQTLVQEKNAKHFSLEETKMIEKDRKKYFFDKLLNTTIDRIQILYNNNKKLVSKQFSKSKQKQIEDNIENLKTFKNYDFNNKLLKEMINKMNLVSYNKRKLVQKTWHEDSLEKRTLFFSLK